jgi:hypothetical protein
MGLYLSACRIANELGLDRSDVRAMTTTLRQGIVDRRPQPALSGDVECDEVYVVTRHKRNPEAVKNNGPRKS